MRKIIIILTMVLAIFSYSFISLAEINPNQDTQEVNNEKSAHDLAFQIGNSMNGLLKWGQISTKLLAEQDLLTKDSLTNAETLTMKSTAYTAYCEGCSGTTRTGIDLIKNPDQKVVAVDPNVIPLGTKLYVEGYGVAIAGDIGSDIKGNRIDVFIPSEDKALEWGVKDIEVKILS